MPCARLKASRLSVYDNTRFVQPTRATITAVGRTRHPDCQPAATNNGRTPTGMSMVLILVSRLHLTQKKSNGDGPEKSRMSDSWPARGVADMVGPSAGAYRSRMRSRSIHGDFRMLNRSGHDRQKGWTIGQVSRGRILLVVNVMTNVRRQAGAASLDCLFQSCFGQPTVM